MLAIQDWAPVGVPAQVQSSSISSVSTVTTRSVTPPSDQSTRLSSLDGIRAVAVLVVVAFHIGLARASGGFIGVDIFFVLSGFLITGLLVREAKGTGKISLVGFWFRRARRLVPAALLTIVVSAVLFSFLSSVPERTAALTDGQAATLWYANWHFIGQAQDYFAAEIDTSPFLHFWSLSIEEQFYAVWPLMVFAAVSVRWIRQALGNTWVIVAVPLVAAMYAMLRAASDPTRSYLATDTRVYQLLAGAALAIILGRTKRTDRSQLSKVPDQFGGLRSVTSYAVLAAALGALIWVVTVQGLSAQSRGLIATALTLLLLSLLAPESPLYRPGSPLERTLSVTPLVLVGRISYGIYLWHWPIVVLLTRTFDVGQITLLCFTMAASVACASASWMFVEQPIQAWSSRIEKPRIELLAVLSAIVASLAVALLLLPLALSDRIPLLQATQRPGFSTTEGQAREIAQVPIPENFGRTGTTPFEIGETCINTTDLSNGCATIVNGSEVVLLFGDSHAGDLISAFSMLADAESFTLHSVVTAGCPWQRSLAYVNFNTPTCQNVQDSVYEGLVDQVRPDRIVVISHPYGDPNFEVRARGTDDTALEIPGAEFAARTSQATQELARYGGSVTIIEPRPSSPFDAVNCLAAVDWIDECAFIATTASLDESFALREVAEGLPGVSTVSIDDLVCPRYPLCDPIIGGTLVRYDSDHLYAGFAQRIAVELWARVTSEAAD